MWFPGIKKKRASWAVTLWGKHRSFGDYISYGDENQVVQRFSRWAQREKTLSAVARCIKNEQLISWCYWLKESGRRLNCGVIMTSRDRSGRPNLFIVAGQGEAAGNTDCWESLSLGCLKTWQEMTAVGRENFDDLATLKARLAVLPRPEKRPLPVHLDKGEPFETAVKAVHKAIQANRERCLIDKTVCIEGLDSSEDDFLRHQIACRKIMNMTPHSLFMGGLPANKRLLCFFRQVGESDFIQFWEN